MLFNWTGMQNNSKSSDSLVVFWLTHAVLLALIYMVVVHPSQIQNWEAWIVSGWIFFIISIPAFLVSLLAHFMLLSIDQKYKRLGIRLMSWIAFLVTYELWKASDHGRNFFDPLFEETFGVAALLIAATHIISFVLLERINKKRFKIQPE